jgi:hypothetical protein
MVFTDTVSSKDWMGLLYWSVRMFLKKKEVDRYRILRFGFLRILDIAGFSGFGLIGFSGFGFIVFSGY